MVARLSDNAPHLGTYHAAGASETAWHGFAQDNYKTSAKLGYGATELQPITTEEYPTLAKRPANSILDCSRLLNIFAFIIEGYERRLENCVERNMTNMKSEAG